MADSMKALVYRQYGPPEVLHIEDVPQPEPGPEQVLVRVRASSINSWDWDLLTGKPLAFRLWALLRPKFTIPGADVAGVVAAVGPDVSRFRVGDEVFGDLSGSWGSFAEYVAAPVKQLQHKPAGMSFEQAAACPQAGTLALVGLRDIKPVEPGHKLLINGGGGGAGTFAIQLGKAAGAEVTAVDSAVKLDAMTRAGADRVFDYAKQDYTQLDERFDLIIDTTLVRSAFALARVLAPDGAVGIVGGSPGRLLRFALGKGLSGRKMALVMGEPSADNLRQLAERFEAGAFEPIIDRVYPFTDIVDAYRRFGSGQFCGKIVITM